MKKLILVVILFWLVFFLITFIPVNTTTSNSKGVCTFKYDLKIKEEVQNYGCTSIDTLQECKAHCKDIGAEFFEFKTINDRVEEFNCSKTKAANLATDISLSKLFFSEAKFQHRVAINSKYFKSFFQKKYYAAIHLQIFAFCLSVLFLIAILILKRYIFIPYSVVIGLFLLFSDFLISTSDTMNEFVSLYIIIFSHAYSIAAIYHSLATFALIAIILFVPLYHYIQFKKGILTDTVFHLINFVDKTKSKFNL